MKIRLFSDNIVIAVPSNLVVVNVSAYNYIIALMRTLQGFLLPVNIVRGSITKGLLYIADEYLYGSGLIKAYELENDIAIMPRIIIDKDIENEINKKIIGKEIRKDYDGIFYLDYLYSVDNEDMQDTFLLHKKIVENGITENRNNLRIMQKYLWCKEYHNKSCIKYGIKLRIK